MGSNHNNPKKQTFVKLPQKPRETQLTDTQSLQQSIYQQREEESNCFGCIKYTKTSLKKIDWEYKFNKNCVDLINEFQWVKQIVEMVSTLDLQKAKYYREVNNLKKQKYKPSENQFEDKPNEKQIQAFKKNLKKSVIISFGPNSKAYQNTKMSVINVKKSRLQIQKNSRIMGHKSDIFVQKSMSSLSARQKDKRSFIEFMDQKQFDKGKKKNISKSTTHQLQIFMKFTNILQIHLNDPSCILGRIKSQYIKLMLKKYQNFEKMCKRIQDLVDDVTQFLVILKLGVMDYYNLPSFGDNQVNLLISNEQNILGTCTSILFKDHQFYNLVFNIISNHFKQQQTKFMKILDDLKGSGPQKFTVKDKFCLNHRTIKAYLNQMSADSVDEIVQNIEISDQIQREQPFKNCLEYLKQVTKSRSPINKMKSIVACSEGITKQIQAFYDKNGLKKQKWMLDADQVLSIFAYIIVASRVEHLHTHLFILDSFATGLQSINMTGYYTAVLNCAVQHLQNQYGNLSPEHENN